MTLRLPEALAQVPFSLPATAWTCPATAGIGLHLRHAGRAAQHCRTPRRSRQGGNPVQGPADHAKFAGRRLRRPGAGGGLNVHAMRAIYRFEMTRTRHADAEHHLPGDFDVALFHGHQRRQVHQEVGSISYGAFIVPGLIMLSLLTQSIANASFICFPKFAGTIYSCCPHPSRISRSTPATSGPPRPSRSS